MFIESSSSPAHPESSPPFLNGLNPQQYLAVTTTEGPLLVLSGAGTGKTRVLTSRIAYILQQNFAQSDQILAVTFTNKAANEMKKRIGQLLDHRYENMPWMGTFHSLGVKILRRHAELVGLTSHFTILDTDDAIRLAKQILEAEKIDNKRWTAKQFIHLIDGWKNKALMPDDLSAVDAQNFADGRGQDLYHLYQTRLQHLNACDFGDLLLYPIKIFQNNADILNFYQQKFRYILVDEYQDTNTAQYIWLYLLAQRPKNENINLCCVGDEDQSIYGWRGADIQNILRFEKDFPNATIIRLEMNYRSTTPILQTASHLIAHNQNRLGKNLIAAHNNKDANKVQIHSAWDSGEEAREIGEEIEQLQHQQEKLNDIAILVRASFQMREFEERFIAIGLPYQVIGGPKFYERQEIRDALAYFRLIVQQKDDLAFERIINKPKRGLGPATLSLLHYLSRQEQISLFSAAQKLVHSDELKPKARTSLRFFTEQILYWHQQLSHIDHSKLAEMILDESGYMQMWKNDKSIEAAGRIENLVELIRSIGDYENLITFLEHIALTLEKENNQQHLDAVNIMTLHAAKGLEFKTVFLPGWEEGLFPHERHDHFDGIEEERRLAYVGITRAQKNLHIWSVKNRRIHGRWQACIPSRFLTELPAPSIEYIRTPSSYGNYVRPNAQDIFLGGAYPTPGWQRAKQQHAQRTITLSQAQNNKKTTDKNLNFTVGERVFHIKFGNGTILAIEEGRLSIAFDKAGEKKVMQEFVEKIASQK